MFSSLGRTKGKKKSDKVGVISLPEKYVTEKSGTKTFFDFPGPVDIRSGTRESRQKERRSASEKHQNEIK